jgi:hypothetical protein
VKRMGARGTSRSKQEEQETERNEDLLHPNSKLADRRLSVFSLPGLTRYDIFGVAVEDWRKDL